MSTVHADVEHTNALENAPLFRPASLPCGRVLVNRLVKVAMYEHGAAFGGGPPTAFHDALYRKWAQGGWAMIFTGNVQVCKRHLTLGRDLVVPPDLSPVNVAPFKRLADVMHDGGRQEDIPLAIMQLSHSGRQSANFLGGRWPFQPPDAPSAIPVGANAGSGWLERTVYALTFATPRPLDAAGIDGVVEAFLRGAKLAHAAGYDGVELHASHGYLLASFISPKTNHRSDEYSCRPGDALRLLRRIVEGIRAACAHNFVIGIKLNAADYVNASEDESRALDHLREIAGWRMVDFLEISGGDYEDPEFMVSTGLSPRQAFFAKYSAQAVRVLEGMENAPLVLLTGGLRTSAVMRGALTRRHAHLLGLGRASVVCPDLPILLAHETDDRHDGGSLHATREPNLAMARPLAVILSWIPLPKLVGAGAGIAWYTVQMRRVAAGMPVDYALGGTGAVLRMWFGDVLPVQGLLSAFAAVVIAVLALAVVHADESAQFT